MYKIPFLFLVVYIPYQVYRFITIKDVEKRIVDLLIGVVILAACLTGWPVYMDKKLFFSLIGFAFSLAVAYEAWKHKNVILWFAAIMFFIIAGFFLYLSLYNLQLS